MGEVVTQVINNLPKGVSGNPAGRPKGTGKVSSLPSRTKRNIGQEELGDILKRLKPLTSQALKRLGVLLRDNETTETTRLKAIMLILDKYKDLVQELYLDADDANDEAAEKDELRPATILSLTMIKDDEEITPS